MRLVVCSHKPCWRSTTSASGFATDGGFSFQMDALAQLFDGTVLLVPCKDDGGHDGEIALTGPQTAIKPLSMPEGTGLRRKIAMVPWTWRNLPIVWREIRRADAVHVPIPGDIGTIGMMIAFVLRKRLFVRHCGNWFQPRTAAEHFWKWFMEQYAGGRNVMLATGGNAEPPSRRNPALRWIFSTSLTSEELAAYAVERDLPQGRCRLLTACRLVREKGVGVVIESLPLLAARNYDVTLDVVGDGRELPALKARVDALGLASRVTFHGKVDHVTVMRLMSDADVFCYPTSASEGFPKVVLEALACGLPIVATRISVLGEILDAGCGVPLDAPTPAALATGVELCVQSRCRYQAMSAQAIRTAGQYSLERWRDTIGVSLTTAWGELRRHA
jgi:glycosyltransferase involved in cell wall biosynthesis